MAERQATVRAQLARLDRLAERRRGTNGGKGAVIARIEARDLRDAAGSAESAVKSAENAFKVAQSEAARTASLVKAGALADRDLELAQNAVETAQAQLAAARARLTSAQQELGDTTIRAPISGIVSERPANVGDVVSTGAPIATIIDPSSMRLEASVPAEELAPCASARPVEFEVRGYPGQTFSGRIERINPVADPVTRQVSIIVTVPNTTGRLHRGPVRRGTHHERPTHRARGARARDRRGPAPSPASCGSATARPSACGRPRVAGRSNRARRDRLRPAGRRPAAHRRGAERDAGNAGAGEARRRQETEDRRQEVVGHSARCAERGSPTSDLLSPVS